jgi:hypothetical protein
VATGRKTRENRQISRVRNRVKTAVLTLFRKPRKSGKNADFALILHVFARPAKLAKSGKNGQNTITIARQLRIMGKVAKKCSVLGRDRAKCRFSQGGPPPVKLRFFPILPYFGTLPGHRILTVFP